jgi:hypothetical protein
MRLTGRRGIASLRAVEWKDRCEEGKGGIRRMTGDAKSNAV